MMQFLPGGWRDLQLDIVGFLAILGEASVLTNAQVSALSNWFLLPRLLPAPQALIRTSRPERLEPSTGTVLGAYSGSVRLHVNYIAHLLHKGSSLGEYEVRCQRITRRTANGESGDAAIRGQRQKKNQDKDEEEVEEKAMNGGAGVTAFNKKQPEKGRSPSMETELKVRARSKSWLTALSILGCSFSITLLVLSIARSDGMALLATILLSTLSTLIGLANRWTPVLAKRTSQLRVPPSDVVINYPNGSFLIIKCDEDVARELYWAPEACIYVLNATIYRLVSLAGTLILMFGVICLGNAQLELQIGFAASYIILNAAYWVVAALPQTWHWDLSHYNVEPWPYQYFNTQTEQYEEGGKSDRFTVALWKAIAITQTTAWVKNGSVAPVSEAWDRWTDEAGREARQAESSIWDIDVQGMRRLPEWDCVRALERYLNPERVEQRVFPTYCASV
ncbi:MAG: hypothetical protein Q9190_004660 [Brigantiaea leucoxantha]